MDFATYLAETLSNQQSQTTPVKQRPAAAASPESSPVLCQILHTGKSYYLNPNSFYVGRGLHIDMSDAVQY